MYKTTFCTVCWHASVSGMALWMIMLVCLLIHHFRLEWSIVTNIGWIDTQFSSSTTMSLTFTFFSASKSLIKAGVSNVEKMRKRQLDVESIQPRKSPSPPPYPLFRPPGRAHAGRSPCQSFHSLCLLQSQVDCRIVFILCQSIWFTAVMMWRDNFNKYNKNASEINCLPQL